MEKSGGVEEVLGEEEGGRGRTAADEVVAKVDADGEGLARIAAFWVSSLLRWRGFLLVSGVFMVVWRDEGWV